MSRITANEFIQVPEGIGITEKEPPVTIFFITGNPGLIGYYHSFLSLLSSRLGARVSDTQFQIYGHSLAGFEIDSGDSQSKDTETTQNEKQHNGYYDVEAQIAFLQNRLDVFLKTHAHRPGQKQKVILIGHSVGAYLAMEVLRRHRERQNALLRETEKEKEKDTEAETEFDIIGGVMLFPTVVDIAKSKAGRKLSVRNPVPFC